MATPANPLLMPIVTTGRCALIILGARLFLKEKMMGRQYLGLALALVGIVPFAVSEIATG